ncbi:MAG: response regulator transcription factor [Bacilli bacterium]|nr:response regulator transcription factor [Bacilli bacterium]
MIKLLLVEDDESIVKHLTSILKQENYIVYHADGQNQAMDIIENNSIDIALLDLSLKQGHGFALYNEIKSYKNIPIIFLTASNDEFSEVTGLSMGADDYIPKPFKPRVLLTRIEKVIRNNKVNETIYSYKNISVNVTSGKVLKDNQEIYLSALEYKLLLIFFYNQGRIMTRDMLLEEIWNISREDVNDNTLSVYIRRIRNKIEDDPQNPIIIKTMRGLGYKLGN